MTTDEISYPTYLELESLLSLQHPRSSPVHPDELLFIIVHQASELWFKLIVHELHALGDTMQRGAVLQAVELITRINELMHIVTSQLRALDSLAPHRFAEFRGNLGTSSGGQSVQFRAIEIISGLRAPDYLEYLQSQGPLAPAVADALNRPSLPEAFDALLATHGIPPRDLYATNDHLDLRMLAEGLLAYEQEFGMWRFLHVQMVERIIGPGTRGTGGSLGAAALRDTLGNRFFPRLWAVRAEFY